MYIHFICVNTNTIAFLKCKYSLLFKCKISSMFKCKYKSLSKYKYRSFFKSKFKELSKCKYNLHQNIAKGLCDVTCSFQTQCYLNFRKHHKCINGVVLCKLSIISLRIGFHHLPSVVHNIIENHWMVCSLCTLHNLLSC